ELVWWPCVQLLHFYLPSLLPRRWQVNDARKAVTSAQCSGGAGTGYGAAHVLSVPDPVRRAQEGQKRQPEEECHSECVGECRRQQNRCHERSTQQCRGGKANHAKAQRCSPRPRMHAAEAVVGDVNNYPGVHGAKGGDRKSTRLNSSH